MTVCVATICENNSIFGASDRMLTSGDVQFEPPDIKIVTLSGSIAILTAGDSDIHAEIIQRVRGEIRGTEDMIEEVAEMYARHYT